VQSFHAKLLPTSLQKLCVSEEQFCNLKPSVGSSSCYYWCMLFACLEKHKFLILLPNQNFSTFAIFLGEKHNVFLFLLSTTMVTWLVAIWKILSGDLSKLKLAFLKVKVRLLRTVILHHFHVVSLSTSVDRKWTRIRLGECIEHTKAIVLITRRVRLHISCFAVSLFTTKTRVCSPEVTKLAGILLETTKKTMSQSYFLLSFSS